MRVGLTALPIVFVVTLAAASPAAAAVVKLDIKGIAFPPTKVWVKVGDTVEWTNKDFVAHTATARDGSFNVDLPAGKSGRAVLKKAGAVHYYCRYHPNMTAEIVVRAK